MTTQYTRTATIIRVENDQASTITFCPTLTSPSHFLARANLLLTHHTFIGTNGTMLRTLRDFRAYVASHAEVRLYVLPRRTSPAFGKTRAAVCALLLRVEDWSVFILSATRNWLASFRRRVASPQT